MRLLAALTLPMKYYESFTYSTVTCNTSSFFEHALSITRTGSYLRTVWYDCLSKFQFTGPSRTGFVPAYDCRLSKFQFTGPSRTGKCDIHFSGMTNLRLSNLYTNLSTGVLLIISFLWYDNRVYLIYTKKYQSPFKNPYVHSTRIQL